MNTYLLSYHFKIVGWLLILTSVPLTVVYSISNFKISLPVLAIYSSYLETNFFTVFTTNFADELILLLYLSGFFLVVFSKSKHELANASVLRTVALFKAVFYNTLLLALSILFIYGNGFIFVLLINLFSTFIFYLCFFNWYKMKERAKPVE
jgi:hypothetical protein